MGEVFAGRYELIDPIASGGMGTVWRVLDLHDDEVKAAKMLRQTDAAMLLRFVREQSMRIDHTHVVTPQSWAGVDDRVLFTMPLVRGGSVAGLMKQHGPLSPYWIGHLADQTLQALEAVHAAGIVHRDIKPGNLLLEPTGTGVPHLRLTDFGIAVPEDEPRLTHVAMVIGTPGYMAPEQYAGGDPDPRSDVYALGIVVLEMLTGRRPPGEGAPPPIDLSTMRNGDAGHDAVVDLIEAATRYDVTGRPGAGELRRHPAMARLLALPADPTDGVRIDDGFPPMPERSTAPARGGTAATAYPPPPPPSAAPASMPAPMPPPTAPTLVGAGPERPGSTGASARASYLLLGAGALALLIGILLLLL
ncbi:serine/threonine-protein kinase [Nocardioides sambongensis]|uniref:serine/threonine-protein kinase n=1 Tax=Nocardioides sambongensis TaxID=2589074 RepID=UPI00112E5BB2|nr:serine/threonine-protein kinase [Nocardioides sambongensis]